MNKNLSTSIIFVLSLITLQACTSISQPTASRALVEQQFVLASANSGTIESNLRAALENSAAGTGVIVNNDSLVLGNTYFAATGQTCRRLSSQQSDQIIYCLNEQDGWFKVNKVIAEYNENDFSGAGL